MGDKTLNFGWNEALIIKEIEESLTRKGIKHRSPEEMDMMGDNYSRPMQIERDENWLPFN